MTDHPLEAWHRLVRSQDSSGLNALLADDAVFHSPIIHTPQRGTRLAAQYLSAAFQVFFNPSFRYVREIVGASHAILEFETGRIRVRPTRTWVTVPEGVAGFQQGFAAGAAPTRTR